ncbi:hypothetical protein GGS23DRAFT_598401 [Durotheca rogersii]|uniref:uncharacterized protein n=1 Tax=Durotheca rogersii TaxID=419775 RepID=UPI0022209FA8|nr:uncharacterized protein GGS23DRAFT_598401 [Durotheca rogersii]KAI5861624.1 hypothetical protein GGS23DRAFT_598401 [Durotheca rogersii]
MEATAIVGLVGNVFQFLSFGREILTVAHETYHSATGTSDHVGRLGLLIESIQDAVRDISEKLRIYVSLNDNTRLLEDIAQECGRIAKKLLKEIRKLETKSRGWGRTSDAIRIAARTWWKKQEMVELVGQLIDLEGRLMRWWQDTTASQERSLLLGKLEGVEQAITQANMSRLVDLESQWQQAIQNLDAQMSRSFAELQATIQSSTTRREEPEVCSTAPTLEYTISLESFNQINESILRLVERHHRWNAILKSLAFPSMKNRQENIEPAYDSTNEWVFDSSKTNLQEWLERGTGVYWINGLAGTGKSTLMKFVSADDQTRRALSKWAGDAELVTASYYFWNSGTEMQKSQRGLLQHLLHDIFRASPELARTLCRDREFNEPWGDSELKQIFKRLRGLTTEVNTKFCFFIDGLDEYDGAVEHIIQVVNDLAESPAIKVCAASRPWPAFLAEWGTSPYAFKMQEFTRDDMESYVSGSFTSNKAFSSAARQDSRCHELVQEVVDRSQGVWLWVYLVVRDLLRDIRDNEPYKYLQARLDSIPIELDCYFEQILSKRDRFHRSEAARIMLSAIQARTPMSILALELLDKAPGFILHAPPEERSEDELENLYQKWEPRLQNRCGDLMKITKRPGRLNPNNYQVDFLHQTVSSFLQSKYISRLRSEAPADFNEIIFLCEDKLASLKYVSQSYNRHSESSSFEAFPIRLDLCQYARQLEEQDNRPTTMQTVRNILHEMDATSQYIRSRRQDHSRIPYNSHDIETSDDLLGLAASFGLVNFVTTSLPNKAAQGQLNTLLVRTLQVGEIARDRKFTRNGGEMRRHTMSVIVRNKGLIRKLLALGANPNTRLFNLGMGDDILPQRYSKMISDFISLAGIRLSNTGYYRATPWTYLLKSLPDDLSDCTVKEDLLEIFRDMVYYGADMRMLNYCVEEGMKPPANVRKVRIMRHFRFLGLPPPSLGLE